MKSVPTSTVFTSMFRYTAEFRGGDWDDKPWEWCVIDEFEGPFGSVIAFNLTKEEAIQKADELNEKGKK